MSEKKNPSTRHAYMDVIRIIGCVWVVLVHVSSIDWSAVAVTSFEWKVLNIINSLGMSGVPLFFMISGALFLRENAELTYKYVWKKIGMIALFYLFCLFFYNILPFVRGWEPWGIEYLKKDLLGNILTGGGIYHLWFLPVLMVLYALAPVLKSAFGTKRNCEYFLILFAVFGTVIPLFTRYNWVLQRYMQSAQDRFSVFWLTGQIGYFVLGHYLHEYVRLNQRKTVMAGVMAAGILFFIMTCNYFDAVNKNAPSSGASTPMSITCMLFVSCVFLWVKQVMRRFGSVKGEGILKYLASLTLGIYFIHPFFVENLLKRIGYEQVNCNYAILTVGRIVVVLLLSGVVAAILKKIPFLKRLF